MNDRRFVLLDRDGTIIVERNYLSDHRLVELLPGAAEGLRLMRAAGFGLAVVTNQSGIGRGYFGLVEMDRVHARMLELLAAEEVAIDGIFFCPHTPGDGCDCRKPEPGLIDQAAARFGFDPAAAVVIGDKPCDIELGRRAGATTILVRSGYGAGHEQDKGLQPDYVADDLLQAARIIAPPLADADE